MVSVIRQPGGTEVKIRFYFVKSTLRRKKKENEVVESTTEVVEDPTKNEIVETKIDGMTNEQIQQILQEEFGVNHSPEYISSLWRNKIPKIIASAAEDAFLDNYFTNVEKGQYKKCSRCGEIKLALPKYFSKNKTSRDGFYSICKACRNK
mgnify:CR=1 FL=1